MRKLIFGLLAGVLALLMPVACNAAEETVACDSIGVYAKYVRNVNGEYSEHIDGGSAQVELDNGITVRVTGAPAGAVRLVVHPVDESDALKWMAGRIGGNPTILQAYEIYFLNADEKHLMADGANITIDIEGQESVSVYAVSTSSLIRGKLLASSSKDGCVFFKSNGYPYYVLTSKTENTSNNNKWTNSQIPPTGDANAPVLWTMALLASGAGLALCLGPRKKR